MPAKHSSKSLLKSTSSATKKGGSFVSLIDKALSWGLGILCLLVSVSFYTGTYDTAFVKITLFQTGALILSALWLSLLSVEKRCPVTRQNLPWVLPFLLYFGWNFLGYLLSPYKLAGFDEFFRYILYFFLSFIVLDRFTQDSAKTLTKCIVLAAWISCLYGAVQILDRWFVGIDIMPWRGFFGTRIFSTHANPNFFADFIVFSSCIVMAEYLRTRQKRLLVLLAVAAVDLFFSESKGAWIGFAASAGFFVAVYTYALSGIKKQLRTFHVAAAVLLLGALVLAGVYAAKRFQSVSFRAYTWAGSFAMVQDSPVMGTGVGSFKTIYPAYRKPQIFYIEKAHNNETQHAENEYLEQWATGGTVGLALFLGLLFFVLYGGVRGLKSLALRAQGQKEKTDNKVWWLLGYSSAFFGILVHSFFDISIRFVSTGLFFAVFAALIVRLVMPEEKTEPRLPASAPAVWRWVARGVFLAGVLYVGGNVLYLFGQTAANVSAKGAGDWVLKICAWTVILGVSCAVGGMYLKAAFAAKWVRVPLVLLLSLLPVQWVFGFFLSDHYYGIAAAFSARGLFDGALDFYQKAIESNPFVPGYHQYRAYILRQTMDLSKTFSSLKGDKKGPSTDYDRALKDLKYVEKHVPNHALLHQALGEFYYTYAVYFSQMSQTAELEFERMEYGQKAVENMELAKKSFRHSLLLDPVNEATYVYLTSIALMEKNPAQAQAWIDAYRRGPEGVTEPEFLQIHKKSGQLDKLQMRLWQPPFNYFPTKK